MIYLPDLYLLFSHELTEQQEREAYEELGVKEIYYLPSDLKVFWSKIPPGTYRGEKICSTY